MNQLSRAIAGDEGRSYSVGRGERSEGDGTKTQEDHDDNKSQHTAPHSKAWILGIRPD